MAIHIRRREFFVTLGSAAAWPLASRAQQPAMPVIGFLNPTSAESNGDRLRGFHLGLKEAGYIEGENVTLVYRWAEGNNDRLPALADDLVRSRVSVIAAFATAAAFAAKASTTEIPIVFGVNEDPVRLGLVASLSRPGGSATEINYLTAEVGAKRLTLLRELIPTAARVALLVNPANATSMESTLKDVVPAARVMSLGTKVLNAETSSEINAAFATLVTEKVDALLIAGDAFYSSRRVQLVHLATRYGIPATYSQREFADIGGLRSYGPNFADVFRQIASSVGRLLKIGRANV